MNVVPVSVLPELLVGKMLRQCDSAFCMKSLEPPLDGYFT
ncbi:MAG: hypothetical protein ACJATD_000447 [Alloalcanivorax sp.]|jgi:hypothetical protein